MRMMMRVRMLKGMVGVQVLINHFGEGKAAFLVT